MKKRFPTISRRLFETAACHLLALFLPLSSAVADDWLTAAYDNCYGGLCSFRQPQTARKNRCYQGFGLNYHLGYGYGGCAIGVGQNGGYPCYGGPGYPQPMPELNRGCGIRPVYYNGNPGGPSPECPHYFGIPVGMVEEQEPVLKFQDSATVRGGYGIFTGAMPYPESMFIPPAPSYHSENQGKEPTPINGATRDPAK